MKNRKILLSIIATIVISALLYFGVNILQKAEKQNVIKQNREQIPALALEDVKGNIFNTKDINNKNLVLFIVFNPDCHFCQLEAEEMQEKITRFKGFNIYFVSVAPKKEIQNFAKLYGLENIHNITFLQDGSDNFATTVGANTVPFIMLYNKQHQLIKTYKGSIKLDVILKDAEQYRETSK